MSAWAASFPSLEGTSTDNKGPLEQFPEKEFLTKDEWCNQTCILVGFFGLQATETDSG